MELVQHFISLLNESAPWLLLGLFIAGVIKSFIPSDYLTRHLGGTGVATTIKAAFIGAPLPLCSCGVVPAALGIRRSGGSKNATVSFLIATPETGVDSMTVTYALMGPFMAIIRPIAAIFSAIFAGFLVGSTDHDDLNHEEKAESSCCSKNKAIPPKLSMSDKLKQGTKFAFIDMYKDIVFWLFIGLAFAALIQTYVPESFLKEHGSGWLAFILMALIGVPMYICATASTPMAAGLILSGVSPGAVLVFMLTGPATNIGTLAIIKRELGKRALTAYLSGIVICSFAFGALTNYFASELGISVVSEVSDHTMETTWLQIICSCVLVVLTTFVIWNNVKTQNKTP